MKGRYLVFSLLRYIHNEPTLEKPPSQQYRKTHFVPIGQGKLGVHSAARYLDDRLDDIPAFGISEGVFYRHFFEIAYQNVSLGMSLFHVQTEAEKGGTFFLHQLHPRTMKGRSSSARIYAGRYPMPVQFGEIDGGGGSDDFFFGGCRSGCLFHIYF